MKVKILDIYYFSDNEIHKMNELVWKTKRSHKEYAARIFSNKSQPGELKLTNICSGHSRCVEIPDKCGKGEISLGVFHTHAMGGDNLSISDLEIHIEYKHKIDCLGRDGKTSCFTRKKMKNFRKKILDDIDQAKRTCSAIWMQDGPAKSIAREVSNMHIRLSSELTEKYFDRTML